LPRWDLDTIYSSFDSPSYAKDKERLAALSARLNALVKEAQGARDWKAWLKEALAARDEELGLMSRLGAHAYARYSTATTDPRAKAELNAVEELALPLKAAEVGFSKALAARKDDTLAALSDPAIKPYAFVLREAIDYAAHTMDQALEELASDLQRSGGDAWGRLQESISSNLSMPWDEVGGERKTVVELRNMAEDPDRAVREKAFRKELEAWKLMEIPLAASINGVKGASEVLRRRRGWPSLLDASVFQSRISRDTLDATIGAMEGSLPAFRRYLKAKAKALGLERLAFYDLFAPLAGLEKKWAWDEARAYIAKRFASFSPEFAAYAEGAFKKRWIDAEPREGKVGGAYCIDFGSAKTERVLANYNGSFQNMTTVAHELGHAWHSSLLRDTPASLADYPMTLAETASIFAETLVFEGAAADAKPAERAAILELRLQDACQVVVDILSRFRFESELMRRRAAREVPADELCSMMLDAQKSTYGEGLDPEALHPYMWAVKGHYYSTDLAFYNFPYAFGLLFALGLYARWKERGPSFVEGYKELLKASGSMAAEDVAAMAGIDIRDGAFWKAGLDLIAGMIAEFEGLVGGGNG
jgi:pepF/M3 family oligoendopeptidase